MQINAPRAGWFHCARTSAGAKTIPSGLDCEVIDYIARIGTDGRVFDCGLQATRQ